MPYNRGIKVEMQGQYKTVAKYIRIFYYLSAYLAYSFLTPLKGVKYLEGIQYYSNSNQIQTVLLQPEIK